MHECQPRAALISAASECCRADPTARLTCPSGPARTCARPGWRHRPGGPHASPPRLQQGRGRAADATGARAEGSTARWAAAGLRHPWRAGHCRLDAAAGIRRRIGRAGRPRGAQAAAQGCMVPYPAGSGARLPSGCRDPAEPQFGPARAAERLTSHVSTPDSSDSLQTSRPCFIHRARGPPGPQTPPLPRAPSA